MSANEVLPPSGVPGTDLGPDLPHAASRPHQTDSNQGDRTCEGENHGSREPDHLIMLPEPVLDLMA